MSCAASSSRSSRSLKPRELSAQHRRKRLKTLTRGLAALLIGFVAVPTAMVGAAWALAVSMQARSDIRTTAAYVPPAERLAWPREEASGLSGEWTPVTTQAAEVPKFDLAGTFALFEKKPGPLKQASADRATTGSIGPTAPYKVASLEAGVSDSAANPGAHEEAHAAPLPRARPKLASLTPLEGIGSRPDEERPQRTAIYDISARVVYLPNGEKLEAHSGLGGMMDDPRYVHIRMRGATPPNVYNLRLREAMFHGVQAIRLLPENEHDMFGRAGILAHTYMLGPNGQSNGCVSFRDYSRFLRAFQRGEITRLIVVPRMDKTPAFAARGAKSAANIAQPAGIN